MRLIDRLMARDISRAVLPSGASVLMQTFGTPNAERILPTYLNAIESYSSSGVVFGVIQARMSLFTEAEFKFQRLEDKSLFGSSALLPLEEPWPGGTTGELLARMEQDVSLAGNAYIRRTSEGLERLRPDCVTIISEIVKDANDTEIRHVVGYWFDPTGFDNVRQPTYFPEEEVAHWAPIPDPWATWRGMSWLTPVLREVDADMQLTDYKRAYLNNAATPNLLIKYNGKIGGEKLTRLREQLQARHGGVGNAFKTLVLDEGADASVVGNNLEQLAFSATQAAGENRIAVAGNVPAIVVGLKEGLQAATYSNYEQAMRRFADLFGRPQWRSACAALAKLIEVPADCRLWYDTSAIAALRQGEKEQADTMQVLATAANSLVMAGYTPASINAALSAGDVTLLEHSGLVSVQMQTLQGKKDVQTAPVDAIPPAQQEGAPA